MLEVAHRDGRARILSWTPGEGTTVRTPLLIVPETSKVPVPEWAEAVATAEAKGREGVVELVSGGTWFHPTQAEGDLVVPAPQPVPTTEVQTLLVGDELAVWHDAGGWVSNPRNTVGPFTKAHETATPGRVLWAPALGTPADYALWTYLGVDAFDASPLLLAAYQGIALTTDGPMPKAEAEVLYGGVEWDRQQLAEFNLLQAKVELDRVRAAIKAGTLRGFVERRVYSHPSLVETLRFFDREHEHLEAGTPVHKAVTLPAHTYESLWSPEVERFRRRLQSHYRPPRDADTLVLLPCSATKPYRRSPSHRWFQRALDDSGQRHRVHEVMVTSPLGLVPRELEEVYPADRYDVPVTGHWTRDEEALMREQVVALLENHEYKHVIVHMGASTFTILRDLLPEDTLHTVQTHNPQGKADCDRLRDTLRELGKRDPSPGTPEAYARQKLQAIQALASMQFGPEVAAALADGCKARGRWPFVKLMRGDVQVAMLTEGRGILSLTLDGAKILAEHGVKRVHVQDFPIRKTGSLFAVGVERADPDVRPGDDVVVVHGDEVRAVGQAKMSAEEMTHLRRGVAVTLRHVSEAAKKPRPAPETEVTA